jgi:membrane-bound serine protease (ClpP class)
VRRLSIAGLALVALGLVLGVAGALGAPSTAGAQSTGTAGTAASGASGNAAAPVTASQVLIVKVTGLLDPNLAEFVETQIADAERAGAVVVLQVKSGRSVLSDAQFARLTAAVRDATVPVHSWVGPKASVRGRVAQLVSLTQVVGISADSRLGDLGDLAVAGGDFGGAIPKLADETVDAEEAVTLGIATAAPVIGSFIVELPGVETKTVDTDDGPRREPATPVLFSELTIGRKMMHTVASPPVAYLFFIAGLGLLVFELFTAGIGVAGVTGALCIVLGSYGLAVLPTRPWAVGLLLLATVGYAIDVQTGVPRFWTGVGVAGSIVGSLYLYEDLPLPWLTLLVGVGGLASGMITGMPAIIRTRFSTPTIGRDWMIGEMGVAETAVAPEGLVRVRDALWRARTNRATPIAAGGSIRVAEIVGLILEVEPEEGAARDYRERRGAAGADIVHEGQEG